MKITTPTATTLGIRGTTGLVGATERRRTTSSCIPTGAGIGIAGCARPPARGWRSRGSSGFPALGRRGRAPRISRAKRRRTLARTRAQARESRSTAARSGSQSTALNRRISSCVGPPLRFQPPVVDNLQPSAGHHRPAFPKIRARTHHGRFLPAPRARQRPRGVSPSPSLPFGNTHRCACAAEPPRSAAVSACRSTIPPAARTGARAISVP